MSDKIKILYVDDSPLDRALVQDSLEKEHGGFIITEARSREEFESIITEHKFDLVLTDFNILGYEGLQVLETVKKLQPDVPVIIVTGTGSEEVAAKSIKQGAADYVIKSPQHILRLPQTIKSVIELRKAKSEKEEKEKELYESELRYRQLIEHSPEAIVIHQDGKVIFANNKTFELIKDEKREKLLGIPINEILHPDYLDTAKERIEKLMRGESVSNPVEYKLKRFDNSYFDAEISSARVKFKGKTAFQIVARDITKRKELENDKAKTQRATINLLEDLTDEIEKRKKTEEELQESKEEINRILENSIDGILLTAPDGSIYSANPAACRIFGRSEEELCKIGREGVADISDRKFHEWLKIRKKEGKVRGEVTLIRKDGTKFPAEVSSALFADKAGNVKSSMIVRDISERRKREEEILELNKTLTLSQKIAKLGYWNYDIKTQIPTWSDQIFEMCGIPKEQGEPSLAEQKELIHPDDWELYETSVQKLSEKDIPYDIQYRVVHPNGKIVWIRTIGKSRKSSNGKIVELFGTALDITLLKEQEEEIKINLTKYKTLFESLPAGITVSDQKGKIIESNSAAERLLGLGIEEQKKRSISAEGWKVIRTDGSIMPPEEFASVRAFEENKTIWNVEMGIDKGGGDVTWINVTATPIPLENFGVLITYFDITDRIVTDRALKESEEKFRSIVDNAQVGIFRTSAKDGTLMMANQKTAEIFGYKTIDAACRYYKLSEHYVDPNLRKTLVKQVKKKGRIDNFEAVLTNRLNEPRWLKYSVHYKKDGDYFEGIVEDITENKEIQYKYQTVVDNFPNGAIFLFDKNLVYSFVGGEMLHKMGFMVDQMIGKKATDLYPEELTKITQKENKKIFSGEHVYYEVEYRNRAFANWGIPIYENDKVVEGLVYALDITERKKAEEKLKESEAFLQAAFDNSHAGIAIAEVPDGRLRYVNKAGLMIRGKDADEIVKNIDINKYVSSWKILHFDGTDYLPEEVPLARAVLNGETVKEEFIIGRENEEDKYVLAHAAPINDEAGKRIAAIVVFLDITERKLAERQLNESEERARAIFENSLTGILLADRNGTILEVNPPLVNMLGSPSTEATKKINVIKFGPLKKLGFTQKFVEAVTTKKITSGEDWYQSKWGKKLIVNFSFIPVVSNGKVDRVVGTVEDVTKLREAENALRESEEKYKTLVESAPDAIAIHINGILVFANSAAAKLVESKNKKQLMGEDISKYIHPDNLEEVKNRVKNILSGVEKRNTFEEKYITLKGKPIDVEVTYTPIYYETKKALQIIIRDVSERKRVQAQVIKERNKAQRYLESAGIMMLVLDIGGKITMINRKGAELLGYSKKYIIGKNWFNYFLPTAEAKTVKRIFKRAVSGELVSLEYYQSQVKCRNNQLKIIGWYNNFIKDENGRVKEVISSGEDITDSIKLKTDLESSNAKLTDLTKHMDKIREEERLHLAREIHDDLGQSLTALKLDLTAAKNISDDKEQVNEIISDAIVLTSDTIKSVQQMTSELRPTMIDDLGLIPTIEWYVKQFSERAKLKYHAKIDANEDEIPQPNKIIIYRIIQESLTNIARHAKASKFGISYIKKDKINILTIDDDGIGIDDDATTRVNSHGLIGMQERARAIGAELEIRRRKTKGTRVRLSIPLSSK